MQQPVDIRLSSKKLLNVTHDVNNIVAFTNHSHLQVSRVVIDIEATLYIRKKTKDVSCPSLYIDKLELDDFMVYPFEKNLGIAMPYEFVRETTTHLVFLAEMVKPSRDHNTFVHPIVC